MGSTKFYYIRFLDNCTNGFDIRVYVPKGLTYNKLTKWEEKINKIQDAYNKKYDDSSEFDIYDIIREAANKLGIQYEYPKFEYTINI